MQIIPKNTVENKIVNIPYSGPILLMGGIYGPIFDRLLPVSEIALLLQRQYPVREVVNGEEIALDMSNYNLDLKGDGGEEADAVEPVNNEPQKMPEPEKKNDQKQDGSDKEDHDKQKGNQNDGKNNGNKQNNNGKNNGGNQQNSTSNSKADHLDKK